MVTVVVGEWFLPRVTNAIREQPVGTPPVRTGEPSMDNTPRKYYTTIGNNKYVHCIRCYARCSFVPNKHEAGLRNCLLTAVSGKPGDQRRPYCSRPTDCDGARSSTS